MENPTAPSSIKPKISFSRLDKYSQCPRQYHWIYVLGNERPDSDVLSYGRNVHKLIELMCREVMLDGNGARIDIDPPEIDAWFEGKRKELMLEPHERWRLHRVAEFLIDKEFTLTDIEQEFFIELDEAILTGKPDHRCMNKQGELIILDWKSGRRTYTREEAEDSLQLKIYAWYLIKTYGLPTLRGMWYWREGGHTDPLVPWEEADFENNELKPLVHDLVTAKEFPPKLNCNCGYCPIKMTCPVKDDIEIFTYGQCKDREKLWKARAVELRPIIDGKMEQIKECELKISKTGIPLETISFIEDAYRYVLSMGTESVIDMDALFQQFVPAMDGIIKLLTDYHKTYQILVERDPNVSGEIEMSIEQLKSLPGQLNVLKQIVEPVKKQAKELGVVLPIKEEKPSTKLTYSNVNKPKKGEKK